MLQNLSMFGRIQWSQDKVVSNNYNETKARTQSSYSTGIKWDVTTVLSTEISLNQDFTDNLNLGINPSIIVNYIFRTKQKLILSAGINKNYRLPGMNDLYWFPGGNAGLQPEKEITTDLAVQWFPKTGQFKTEADVNVFFSVINDWIQWRPTEYRYWEPLNIARVFARGMEFHILSEGKIKSTTFSFTGNYVFTVTTDESVVARIENSSGRQLIYIPRHHANLFIHSAYKSFLFNYTIEITGKRFTSQNGEISSLGVLPAYVLQHIALGKKIGHFDIELRVNNLFNKSYQAVLWRAMPGRNGEVSIHYQL